MTVKRKTPWNALVTALVIVLALALAACGKSVFTSTGNSEKRMTITAENAKKDASFAAGTLIVDDGEQIEITSGLSKGEVRVEITAAPEGQSADKVPDGSGAPIITAVLHGTDGASGTVPAGGYLVKAACLTPATGTITIEVTKAEAASPGEQEQSPASEAEILADFTVECIDGSAFTLSEALKDHELVLINLFFTNCPPCRMEFPFLQEAWEGNRDRVAVIALSPDPTDTDEVLTAYARELGLGFPIAHEEGTGLEERYVTVGFPTSMLIDRSGKVAMVECGAKDSTQAFLDWFDGYTGENYDPGVCTYTTYCYGVENYEDVEGVVVNFCTDTTCTPVTSAESGAAVFTGPPTRYHAQIVRIPEGWELASGQSEWTTEPYGETYWIGFKETDK